MDATGTLRLVLDQDPWDSRISFEPGIPVTLGGTLELTFAPGVIVPTQIGRPIDVFDWTGVTATDQFQVASPYGWDLSRLYTTGEITLTSVPEPLRPDFDGDGDVDGVDFLTWQASYGVDAGGDADRDGDTDGDDFLLWQTLFGLGGGAARGAVPEPASVALLGALNRCGDAVGENVAADAPLTDQGYRRIRYRRIRVSAMGRRISRGLSPRTQGAEDSGSRGLRLFAHHRLESEDSGCLLTTVWSPRGLSARTQGARGLRVSAHRICSRKPPHRYQTP